MTDKPDIPLATTRQSSRRVPKKPTHPSTSDPEYTKDEIEFMFAMDRYKRLRKRPCPTWREVHTVILSLGYRKIELNAKLQRKRKS